MNRRITEALELGGGIVTAWDVPAATLSRATQVGHLRRLLPGVYCHPASAADLATRVSAVGRWDARAIVTHRAAAAITWWPELRVDKIRLAATRSKASATGYDMSRSFIPPDQRIFVGQVCCTTPARTVLDLIDDLGGQAIDEALRRRAVTLDELRQALAAVPWREGNQRRAALIHDSRDQPWSEAERSFHQVLRKALPRQSFRTNHPVQVGASRYLVDVALLAHRLVFEVDGFENHGSRTAFERDRRRDIELKRAGWRVVRFSAAQVLNEPEYVAGALRDLVRRSAQGAA